MSIENLVDLVDKIIRNLVNLKIGLQDLCVVHEDEIKNLKDKIKKMEEEAMISSQFGLPFFVVPRNDP